VAAGWGEGRLKIPSRWPGLPEWLHGTRPRPRLVATPVTKGAWTTPSRRDDSCTEAPTRVGRHPWHRFAVRNRAGSSVSHSAARFKGAAQDQAWDWSQGGHRPGRVFVAGPAARALADEPPLPERHVADHHPPLPPHRWGILRRPVRSPGHLGTPPSVHRAHTGRPRTSRHWDVSAQPAGGDQQAPWQGSGPGPGPARRRHGSMRPAKRDSTERRC